VRYLSAFRGRGSSILFVFDVLVLCSISIAAIFDSPFRLAAFDP
jgi:hypothetical protein